MNEATLVPIIGPLFLHFDQPLFLHFDQLVVSRCLLQITCCHVCRFDVTCVFLKF